MANASDFFAGALTAAVLSVGGEEVQSTVVDDMVQRLDRDGDLDSQLAWSGEKRKAAGDFGMEIASALVIPVLIEAGKGLWAAYAKKLGEKVGGELADLTYKQVVKLVQWLWSGSTRKQVEADFEVLLKSAASKYRLSPEQVEALAAAVRSPDMDGALKARVQE